MLIAQCNHNVSSSDQDSIWVMEWKWRSGIPLDRCRSKYEALVILPNDTDAHPTMNQHLAASYKWNAPHSVSNAVWYFWNSLLSITTPSITILLNNNQRFTFSWRFENWVKSKYSSTTAYLHNQSVVIRLLRLRYVTTSRWIHKVSMTRPSSYDTHKQLSTSAKIELPASCRTRLSMDSTYKSWYSYWLHHTPAASMRMKRRFQTSQSTWS